MTGGIAAPRRRAALPAALVALTLGAGAAAWLAFAPPPDTAPGGAFRFVDGAGAPVSERDFRGRYRIMYFGYTFCPDVCPTALASLASALDALSEAERARVAGMFVSVDPTRDHGADLEAYAQAFHPLIHGYTGTPADLADAARRYRVTYAIPEGQDAENYFVDHSSIIYVFGPDGRYLTHFTHRSSVEKMIEGLRAAIPG
jgi:protein SCO1/2